MVLAAVTGFAYKPEHAAQRVLRSNWPCGGHPRYTSRAPPPEPGHPSRPSPAPSALSTEVPVGPANGLDHPSVVSCDNILTVPVTTLGRQLGFLFAEQETALTEAIRAALDLD